MNQIILAILCCSAIQSWAIPLGPLMRTPPDDVSQEIAHDFRGVIMNGKRLKAGSACAAMLTMTAIRWGRALTVAEVRHMIPTLLAVTGEVLEPDPVSEEKLRHQVSSSRGPSLDACFSGTSRVLTPRGYVEIYRLAVGDEVISLDPVTGQPAANPIAEIFVTTDRSLSQIQPREGRLPMLVTASHPFYVPKLGRYQALGELADGDELLQIADWNKGQPTLQTLRRGPLRPGTPADVYNLHLTFPPNNFVVEGILVHNSREKI